MSHRNRLIAYRPTTATTLRISGPGLLQLLESTDGERSWGFFFPPEDPEKPAEGFESDTASKLDAIAVASRRPDHARRSDEIEVTERSPRRIARILDNLAKRSSTEFQDKALRILYIAAGFLDWHDQRRDKAISSPLMLVPVELRRASTREAYRLFFLSDEDVVVNPSLTEKLRRDEGLDLPSDWSWEDKSIDVELAEVRAAVAGRGWSVREEAVLGLFSFQKHVMYRDLLDNEAQVIAHPMIRSLAEGRRLPELRAADPGVPELGDLDDAQPPAETLSILDADASQRQCVEAAKRGCSFVMQGPPGTGKSQTIANVIAEAIGQGKRVLFVSEKAAALDVVHKRLSAKGLDEYCLMLHGEHAGRREVVQALDASLTGALSPQSGMRNDEMERLSNFRVLLNDTAELLHLAQPLLGGRSVREVHEQLATLHATASVPGAPEPEPISDNAVLEEFHHLSEVFQRLTERWHVSRRGHPWSGYAGDRFTADDRGRVLRTVRMLREAIDSMEQAAAVTATRLGVSLPIVATDAEALLALGRHLAEAPALEAAWLATSGAEDEVAGVPLATRLAAMIDDAEEAHRQHREAIRAFEAAFPARSLDDFPLDLPGRLGAAERDFRWVCGQTGVIEKNLSVLRESARSLDTLVALIGTVRDRAAACREPLGLPAIMLTRDRLGEIADLADLSFRADPRPPAEWLLAGGRERARTILEEVRADLSSYQSALKTLVDSYRADVLDLDGAALERRFKEEYTSFFSRLSRRYRADARAIKTANLRGELPETIVADLELIRGTQEAGARLDAASERMEHALGRYAAGRLTDPRKIDQAITVAARAAQLAGAEADLAALGNAIGIGSQPDTELARAAERLRASMGQLIASLPLLQLLVATPRLFDGTLQDLEVTLERCGPAIGALSAFVVDLDLGADLPAASIGATRERVNLIHQARTARDRVSTGEDAWSTTIGGRYRGADTDWASARRAAIWLARLLDFPAVSLNGRIGDELRTRSPPWPGVEGLSAAWDHFRTAASGVAELFDPNRRETLERAIYRDPLRASAQFCDSLEAALDELPDWTEWCLWRSRSLRWEPFVDGLIDATVAPEGVVAAFERAYWSRRLEALYGDEPDLAEDLQGGAFQRWVEEFTDLDRRLVSTGADRLIARRESTRTHHVSTEGSEIGLLRREARKQRRHIPVRALLARIPTLLSELKPCLMMSPLTVSHFLAPEHTFDLVIFDEASQVPPQDAVNCIYRGKQLIVAGDSKQLPPTTFFQIAELDELSPVEEEMSTQEDMESILDACEVMLPAHPLRWHYRSRAEALIAFSNQHIYDGALVTFPSADARSGNQGISFTHVPDGLYDRGRSATNRREAQVVAGRVRELLLDGAERSLGVIAFNTAQAAAIAEEIDLLRIATPEIEEHFRGDRLDAVFVKHLEAVQGDERDVILFSIGYGRGADGTFAMNFGPVNRAGGHRRLNVAITRARERVEVVSSVRAHDFSLPETASAGARMLRDYIAYAEVGSLPTAATDERPEPPSVDWTSRLEEQIAIAVRELGYVPIPRVGVGSFRIDIGVRSLDDADRFLLGIECDGEGYSGTPTARDRERLRHEVLAGLGWGRIHRIWSLDWVRNRRGEIQRLQEALTSASVAAAIHTRVASADLRDTPASLPKRVERAVLELDTATAAAALAWTETYRAARLDPVGPRGEFHAGTNRGEQVRLLGEVLQIEAPVSVEVAVRRVATAWGLQRTTQRVLAAGRQAVLRAARDGLVEVRGDYLWRPGQVLARVRVPDPTDPMTRRSIDDIPPEEVDLAVSFLAEASPGLGGEQLVAQTARVLGFDRTGGLIRSAVERRIEALCRAGVLPGDALVP